MAENKIQVTPKNVDAYRSRGHTNEDLLPKTEEQRNMGLVNYFTLWMGNLHNIPNYASVGGFLVLGLAPINVMLALMVGAVATGLLMALNGRAGAKYGIPFSMQLRSAYGSTGAKIPGVLRGVIVAIGWFGLQTYVGSQALLIIIGRLWPGFMELGGNTNILGLTIPGLISFVVFWLINVYIGLGGGSLLNKFNNLLTILIYVLFIGMGVWGVRVGGGFSNILQYTASDATSSGGLFFSSLMVINAVLAFWSAPTSSVGDFTQYANSEKDQRWGQLLSLVIGYLVFVFTSMTILIGASINYGTEIWDALEVINRWDSIPAVLFATLVLLLITVNSNATANVTPAAYQFSALFPDHIDYKKGVWLASILGVLIMPWKLMENPDSIYTFLNGVGAVMGPVIGIMLYQYFVIDKQNIDLDELYFDEDKVNKNDNKYVGANFNALLATLIGFLASIVGNFISALSIFSSLSLFTGLIGGVIAYALLEAINKNKN